MGQINERTEWDRLQWQVGTRQRGGMREEMRWDHEEGAWDNFLESLIKAWVESQLRLVCRHNLNGQDCIRGSQFICFLDSLLFSLALKANSISIKIRGLPLQRALDSEIFYSLAPYVNSNTHLEAGWRSGNWRGWGREGFSTYCVFGGDKLIFLWELIFLRAWYMPGTAVKLLPHLILIMTPWRFYCTPFTDEETKTQSS